MDTNTASPSPHSDRSIGLDLARHRTLCAASIDGTRSVIPLAATHRGLILRWVDLAGNKHRITDRLLDTAGVDDLAARETAREVARCVFPEGLPVAPVVAVPPAFGPACRSALVAGFGAAGIDITGRHLIDRPVAAFASWLAHRRRLGSPAPIGPMLAIDNDGGQLSVCAIDADAARIVFSVPLSSGPDEAADVIVDRLHDVVRELDRLRSRHELVRSDDWATVSATISQIVVSGSMSEHSRFVELLSRVLPASAVVRDPVVQDSSEIVGSGLVNLDALDDWTAGWPTLGIAVDGVVVRPAGPIHSASDRRVRVSLSAQSVLTLVDADGAPVPVHTGSVHADALALPHDLGPSATIEVIGDGRVLVLGPEGVRPLALRVGWPIGRPDQRLVAVGAIGRRPLQLVNPRDDRSRRTTAA